MKRPRVLIMGWILRGTPTKLCGACTYRSHVRRTNSKSSIARWSLDLLDVAFRLLSVNTAARVVFLDHAQQDQVGLQ
ncbi:MAG TPA: hypothetical protein VGL99_14375 [Chloroflexota bacterium]|jgi:hypothetical protein